MITVRRARPTDAAAIGAVHVAAWRSTYPGILPDAFLSRLSIPRQAAHYDHAIRTGTGVHVAIASGADLGRGGGPARIVGFVTDGPQRDGLSREERAALAGVASPVRRAAVHSLGDGEIETLYVLDDWRDRGIGRRLMRAAAVHLSAAGCRSAYLWVLRDNPSRWFYARLGGRQAAESTIQVGGSPVVQTAYVWEPIDKLAQATSQAS